MENLAAVFLLYFFTSILKATDNVAQYTFQRLSLYCSTDTAIIFIC